MTEQMLASNEKLTKKQKKTLKFKEAKKNKGEPKLSFDNPPGASDNPRDDKITGGLEPDCDLCKDNSLEENLETRNKVKKEAIKFQSTPNVKKKPTQGNKEILDKGSLVSTKPAKNARYIVFVGNLPYDCTLEELLEHLKPCGGNISARLITDKNTNKFKGFAFVEFENSVSLSKALHLHHSTFKGRKINVEVTAGGGGSSNARKEKLKERNNKLTKERALHAKKKVPKRKQELEFHDPTVSLDPAMNPERAKLLSKKPKMGS